YDPENISDDAFDRANHTGTQAISTITDLQDELDNKLILSGGTLTGNLNLETSLVIEQGSSGTPGESASLRADFDNLYLTNNDGKVIIEMASDQSHALGI